MNNNYFTMQISHDHVVIIPSYYAEKLIDIMQSAQVRAIDWNGKIGDSDLATTFKFIDKFPNNPMLAQNVDIVTDTKEILE